MEESESAKYREIKQAKKEMSENNAFLDGPSERPG